MTKVVPVVPEEEGNTITSSSRIVPSIKWCFTLNNYNDDDIGSVVPIFRGLCKVAIIGKEVGENGTPHLQGYVEFIKKCRPLSLKLTNKIHWEKARGSKEENEAYCSKEENVILKIGFDSELRVISILKDWQKKVVELVSNEPDDRSINWYYDYKGGIGKSALVKLLCYKYGAIVCSGKAADMKYMIVKYKEKNGVYPKVVIFDIPRSVKDYVSYSGIEEIKNGCFASSKYECDMILMNSPHILCFANEIPEFDKLSKDRWKITDLNPVCDFEE